MYRSNGWATFWKLIEIQICISIAIVVIDTAHLVQKVNSVFFQINIYERYDVKFFQEVIIREKKNIKNTNVHRSSHSIQLKSKQKNILKWLL